MITDKIENIDTYKYIPQYAIDFIKNLTSDVNIGRYKLNDEDFANVETYITKNLSDAKYEKHNKYIDIQLLLKGEEKIYYKDSKALSNISVPYNQDRDISFYSDSVEGEYIKLDGTNFVMLFPHEAHAPQVNSGTLNENVLKAVVKIKI